MVVPVLGHIVAELAYIANVYFWVTFHFFDSIISKPSIPPSPSGGSAGPVQSLPSCYLLLCCLYSLGGGTTTLLMGVYSMLADTTQAAARTTRHLS